MSNQILRMDLEDALGHFKLKYAKAVAVIRQFYLEDNGRTCKEVLEEVGVSGSTYRSQRNRVFAGIREKFPELEL